MVNHFRPCQIPLETRELLVEKLCISIFEEADVELALTYKIDWSRHPGSEIGSPLQPASGGATPRLFPLSFLQTRLIKD